MGEINGREGAVCIGRFRGENRYFLAGQFYNGIMEKITMEFDVSIKESCFNVPLEFRGILDQFDGWNAVMTMGDIKLVGEYQASRELHSSRIIIRENNDRVGFSKGMITLYKMTPPQILK